MRWQDLVGSRAAGTVRRAWASPATPTAGRSAAASGVVAGPFVPVFTTGRRPPNEQRTRAPPSDDPKVVGRALPGEAPRVRALDWTARPSASASGLHTVCNVAAR